MEDSVFVCAYKRRAVFLSSESPHAGAGAELPPSVQVCVYVTCTLVQCSLVQLAPFSLAMPPPPHPAGPASCRSLQCPPKGLLGSPRSLPSPVAGQGGSQDQLPSRSGSVRAGPVEKRAALLTRFAALDGPVPPGLRRNLADESNSPRGQTSFMVFFCETPSRGSSKSGMIFRESEPRWNG